jgi:UDP-glucose 4-epimerase
MPEKKRAGKARKTAPRLPTIALTGTNTFLGERLLRRLQARAEHQIVCIDIRRPRELSKAHKFYKVDLTHPTADALLAEVLEREQVDTLVHLAFHTNPSRNQTQAHELQVIGTLNLLHACAKHRLRKLIVRSSTMVYGAHPSNPNFLAEAAPLRAAKHYPFVADQAEVEQLLMRHREKHPETCITVLRPCSILGPTVRNFITDYLRRPVCMTLLGFDPLFQLVHENDVVDAFEAAIENDRSAAYNIVGPGVLPLSTILRLAGRIILPVAHPVAYPLTQAAWLAGVSPVPGAHLDYIRFLWVADGARAEADLGFRPRNSTRDTIEAFAGIQRLRDAHLIEHAG